MVIVPSRKLTVPVAAEAEIVAVRVTLPPAAGAVFDTESEVVVVAGCAVTPTAEEVLVA
jgi:hypothetical protein